MRKNKDPNHPHPDNDHAGYPVHANCISLQIRRGKEYRVVHKLTKQEAGRVLFESQRIMAYVAKTYFDTEITITENHLFKKERCGAYPV